MVVGDLLLFSHVYAGWRGLRRGRPRPGRRLDIGARHLSVLAAAVGLATFLVRLVFPLASERYVDLNWYQWPECVALFALGIMAAPSGWLTTVSEQLCGHSRTATLVAGRWDRGVRRLGSRLRGLPGDTWMGGWHVEALMFAALESTLAVFGPCGCSAAPNGTSTGPCGGPARPSAAARTARSSSRAWC